MFNLKVKSNLKIPIVIAIIISVIFMRITPVNADDSDWEFTVVTSITHGYIDSDVGGDAGDDVIIEYEADDGYVISQVLYDGVPQPIDEDMVFGEFTIENIQKNHTLEVICIQDENSDIDLIDDSDDPNNDPSGDPNDDPSDGPNDDPSDDTEIIDDSDDSGDDPVDDPNKNSDDDSNSTGDDLADDSNDTSDEENITDDDSTDKSEPEDMDTNDAIDEDDQDNSDDTIKDISSQDQKNVNVVSDESSGIKTGDTSGLFTYIVLFAVSLTLLIASLKAKHNYNFK